MYRKCASRLRLLVCGGDGTVGWVLSVLDALAWPVHPPMAILPMGTGNDLARALGWGGQFTDAPLAHLLQAVVDDTQTHVQLMDRWTITVAPNLQVEPDAVSSTADADEQAAFGEQTAVDHLPLTVMNNYFSIGADAHVALQFHNQRSESAF